MIFDFHAMITDEASFEKIKQKLGEIDFCEHIEQIEKSGN